MKNFIPFPNLTSQQYGGKANNLATLYREGYNVPNGFIVSAKTIEQKLQSIYLNKEVKSEKFKEYIFDNQAIFDEIIQKAWLYSRDLFGNRKKVAIRSSANLEDGTHHSFAGQFTSVLNLSDYDTFQSAFITCLLSKYNEEALSYCQSKAIDPEKLKLNIIVQEMVLADFSGVCFSVNPMSGNEKEMLIEVVDGLGEKLVQGQTTPNSYLVNWYDDVIVEKNQKNSFSFPEDFVLEIVNESLKIQQYFGVAQDIEWAIKDGKLFILQARPLTAIQFQTKYDWTNADLKDGGVSSEISTPFMYKLYENAFETTMSSYLKSVKIHPPYHPDKWFTQFMLFSYWNLTATKDGVKKIPGFIEREFDEDLGVQARYTGKGYVTKTTLKSIIEGLQILFAIKKSIKKTIENAQTELNKIDEIIQKNNKINWNELSDTAFVESAKNLVTKDYLNVEGAYFVVIYNNSNLTTLFKDFIVKKDKKGRLQYLKLITGLQNLSHLQPSFALWKLSRIIRKDEKTKAYYTQNSTNQISESIIKGTPFPLKDEIELFIQKYGFHSEKELNILTPNWRENPSQFISILKDFVNKKDKESILLQNKKQQNVFDTEFQKIQSKKLKKEVLKHRYFLWLREEYRDRSSQMYDIIRKVYLLAGKRLVNQDVLKNDTDIFFVNPESIAKLFIADAKQIDIIKKNKIIFKSFRNYTPPNEIWSSHWEGENEIVNDDGVMKGIACSYGIIEAKVFVAKSVRDADNMPNGSIMVTQFTDPAWTIYFSKISGLITETGGVLSHGAIISREYGIPAVLGVSKITSVLKTGDVVRLNGNNGTVELINTLE